jgi:hypothetical protein
MMMLVMKETNQVQENVGSLGITTVDKVFDTIQDEVQNTIGVQVELSCETQNGLEQHRGGLVVLAIVQLHYQLRKPFALLPKEIELLLCRTDNEQEEAREA